MLLSDDDEDYDDDDDDDNDVSALCCAHCIVMEPLRATASGLTLAPVLLDFCRRRQVMMWMILKLKSMLKVGDNILTKLQKRLKNQNDYF